MTQGNVAIMLVDDHEVVRMGLRTLLDRRQGFAVSLRRALWLRP